MKRVSLIVMLLLAALVSFSLMPNALAKGQSGGGMGNCMAECDKCASMCKKSEKYCKSKGGKHADPKHLASFEDCIQDCTNSANLMRKGSPGVAKACKECADACDNCASSCEAFKDDKTMKACAQECHKCSDSCKKMAG